MGWYWYPKPKPRRPANGIRAQSQRGQFGKTWWAGKWLAALEHLVDPARLGRGRSYARSGQVLNIDIEPGHIQARVQGSRPSPYKISIKIKPLSAAEWEKVTEAMSRQAIFTAKLLAGEMPQNIEEAFAQAGVSLFPAKQGDLVTDCSCPDWANPCKHIAAVYYLLGEQFDADPFLLFRLRGKNKAELISMLRAHRATPEAETATPARRARRQKEGAAAPSEPVVPLQECLDHFYAAEDSLQDFRVEIKPAEIDAAPVKRLGAPGFWHGRGDFVDSFARAYREITQASLALVVGSKQGTK